MTSPLNFTPTSGRLPAGFVGEFRNSDDTYVGDLYKVDNEYFVFKLRAFAGPKNAAEAVAPVSPDDFEAAGSTRVFTGYAVRA